jgi:uncharacterized membrane protein
MKRTLLIVFGQFCLMASGANALADVVTLKDGSQISGLVESGGTRAIQVKVGETSQPVSVDRIQSIQFDAPGLTAVPTQPQTLPSGTKIPIRTIDALDSRTADEYKEYSASVDDAVVVDGVTVIPAKAAAFLHVKVTKARLVSIHPTSAVLSISLVALQIDGGRIEVSASQVQSKGASHTLRDVAAGAAAGAATGAVFGGPIGAAVGAGVGGFGGVVFDQATGHVAIPSETRFTYTLPEPLTIDYQGGAR